MADTDAGTAKGTVIVVSQDDQQQQKVLDIETHDKSDNLGPCKICLKLFFIVVGVISVLVSIALIILAVLTSIATKVYDADQSGRIAAMLLLAVSAAVSISIVIYGQVAVLKRKSKPITITGSVLLVVVIVQSLISGIAIKVDDGDKASLVKSLNESFRQSLDQGSRHHKIWATTQADLECCGLDSPNDYRNIRLPNYFPPDVPISCCPSYDPKRSELAQEKDRALCKAKKIYYKIGCEDPVLTLFTDSAQVLLSVTILLTVVEAVLLATGYVLMLILKKEESASSTS